MGLYGDQVTNGKWSNSDGKTYDSDESSYNGDSDQEADLNIRQFEEASEAANWLLIAHTEYAHLVQFLASSEGGPSTLQACRAHLQRELDEGRYPFPVFNVDTHEDLFNP